MTRRQSTRVLEKREKLCYTFTMDKGIIIAGKDFPETRAFVKAASANGFSVITSLADDESAQIPAEPVKGFVWQKASPVSARSFVFEAQTVLPKLTHALLIFDTLSYINKIHLRDSQSLSSGIDDLIASYMHITRELLGRFAKLGGGTLCFVFKPYSENAKFGARKEAVSPSQAFVLAAASAFKTFAEQTALSDAFASGIDFLLCEEDPAAENDGETADFVFSALSAAETSKSGGKKQAARWLRPGSKFSVGWHLFNR